MRIAYRHGMQMQKSQQFEDVRIATQTTGVAYVDVTPSRTVSVADVTERTVTWRVSYVRGHGRRRSNKHSHAHPCVTWRTNVTYVLSWVPCGGMIMKESCRRKHTSVNVTFEFARAVVPRLCICTCICIRISTSGVSTLALVRMPYAHA